MVVPKNIKAFHHSDYILIYVLSAEGLAFKLIVSSFPRLLHNFCSNGESFLSLYWELSRYLKLCSILSFTASLTWKASKLMLLIGMGLRSTRSLVQLILKWKRFGERNWIWKLWKQIGSIPISYHWFWSRLCENRKFHHFLCPKNFVYEKKNSEKEFKGKPKDCASTFMTREQVNDLLGLSLFLPKITLFRLEKGASLYIKWGLSCCPCWDACWSWCCQHFKDGDYTDFRRHTRLLNEARW